MARGTQLQDLVFKLRAEIGDATDVSLGVDKLDSLKHVLRRVQETLYDDYDWPFLRVMPTKALAAGQQYYDMPATLNIERIEDVQVWHNSRPNPIGRGISFEEYAVYDSSADARADPVLRWDVRWSGSATQIEVWPLPSTNTMKLQFKGIRPLRALISNSDTCDLDDLLIVLFAAAEILARRKSKDAEAKLADANKRYLRLRGRSSGGSSETIIGGGGSKPPSRGHSIIRVS